MNIITTIMIISRDNSKTTNIGLTNYEESDPPVLMGRHF